MTENDQSIAYNKNNENSINFLKKRLNFVMLFDKIIIHLFYNERRISVASLSPKRKNQIEEKALQIRQEYKLSASFDLISFLTNRQGYEIQLQQIDDDTTGLLFINDEEKVARSDSHNVIVINAKLTKDRFFEQKRRFICAHEYGHAILHKGEAKIFARRDTSKKETTEELEAEYFAYCLLLSKQAIDQLMTDSTLKSSIEKIKDNLHISTGEVIAMLFNVTPKKANARLEQLGYTNGETKRLLLR